MLGQVSTYLDGLEHLLHQLARLREPLAEQRVAVDLDEVAVVEAGAEPNAQLLTKKQEGPNQISYLI